MRLIVTLGCFLAFASGMSDTEKKIWRDINSFNQQVICWGHKNTMAFTASLHEVELRVINFTEIKCKFQAIEQCTDFGKPKNPFTKPASAFAQLQQGFQTLPQPIGNRWQKIFKGLLNRNKRQAEGGLLEATEED